MKAGSQSQVEAVILNSFAWRWDSNEYLGDGSSKLTTVAKQCSEADIREIIGDMCLRQEDDFLTHLPLMLLGVLQQCTRSDFSFDLDHCLGLLSFSLDSVKEIPVGYFDALKSEQRPENDSTDYFLRCFLALRHEEKNAVLVFLKFVSELTSLDDRYAVLDDLSSFCMRLWSELLSSEKPRLENPH